MESRDVEEQLRSTLHCDDKEKLRRKLALLKREYLRTAQRLQRAERLEGVRRHVRTRISQQDLQDQKHPAVKSKPALNPVTLDLPNATTADKLQCLKHTEGPADLDNLRRSQVTRFLLPTDAACPQTPDPSHDAVGGHRPSPALRLRSRRSRLLWERRSAEVCRITDNSEELQEQSEKLESVRTKAEEKKIISEEAEVVNENEELLSSSESDSPSLLLTHWKTHAHSESSDTERKEMQEDDGEQKEKEDEATTEGKESESTSLLLKCHNATVHTEERGRDLRTDGEIGEGEEGDNGGRETTLCDKNHNENTEEPATEKIENQKTHNDTTEVKEIKIEGEEKSAGVLESCTLVEGLLFPVEYYVRTTRRMASLQSQPDMQAVLLSQLSAGRHRRGRGRGLGRQTHTSVTSERSDLNTQDDFSSPTAASVDPHESSVLCSVAAPEELSANSQSKSQNGTDTSLSPAVSATHPGAVRRRGRRRARGRGRSQTQRSFKRLDIVQAETSVDPLPALTPLSSNPSLDAPEGLKPPLTPQEHDLLPDKDQAVSTCHTGSGAQPSPGVDGAQCSPASRHLQKVYPMFLMKNTPSQRSRSASSWRSLLLPSSPFAQTSLFPLPSPSTGSLVNRLMTFDIHQDFHLPDDQFASLKLHKLRQVALESGVEHFTPPSYNTRSSMRLPRSHLCSSTGDPVVPLPLPLSPTPTVAMKEKDVDSPTDSKLLDKSSNRDETETPGEHQTENLAADAHSSSTEPVSGECPAGFADETLRQETEDTPIQSSTLKSIRVPVKPQPDRNCAGCPASKANSCIVEQSNGLKVERPASEGDACCPGAVSPVEDQTATNHQREDRAVIKTLCFDCPPEETAPVKTLTPAKHSEESSEPTARPRRDRPVMDNSQKSSSHPSVQIPLSPPLTSAHCPFTTPHLPSSALLSSPMLPSLGLTPLPVSASLPLTSSPSAPALTLPLPHSPATQDLSCPTLSPCPSITPSLSSQPIVSDSGQDRAWSELSPAADRHPSVEAATFASSIQSGGAGRQEGERREETAVRHVTSHTLKAPAGGCLVDTCCLPGPSGGLCVAAAGKWAVCLWSQTPASDWSLTHTWTFSDRVISVSPVPDAAGLLFVTLGQLEIREVRVLSCSSLTQVLLCEGVVQVVVGVSRSRVVTSSHSATGSTLSVFHISDNNSTPSSLPLESPGLCVGALAPVDGLSDALIGTDEGGRVFVWNLKSGQLLRSFVLGDGLSHTACLRGYSHCGVLFVLLQHQLLSSLEDVEKEAKGKDEMFSEEDRKQSALFSLVGINPLSGKSVLATRLYPPTGWSGRLCEADAGCSNVVGLSQSGCVCVWELGRPGFPRMVWAPETEGWQLARWGGPDTLVTGHNSGDVTVHFSSNT